ncbi:serine hydrolase domain-containing protein [Pseudomonas gingeri]|uniref:Beta-lactamase family protein n=1 Tax=Pseudomonas gingeri TaxID=117681 RepID=A0A7Y7YJZ6_9PSED|nr:serine hydrolase domain-containing protein [Pseudomonas gingeri]NWA04643.1 beta-lactamase family protein [Pseudomonas gingeri]NWA13979.1 beta-lactamase family protein [Pseudomonas gingeri]NWA59165.1 beta-lactamase family protein [Pseudomonas gingeri]NWA99474.1 beta-lactamase family protein [Pseudomonas gingeri]NWB05848.1 beta-lactamase family protein [Pseudomonas gingeri]
MDSKTRQNASSSHGLSRRQLLVGASMGGLGAALAGPLSNALAATRQPTWDRAEAMDAVIVDAVNRGRIVGATVIAAKDGEIVYRRAAGFADREQRRPMQEDEICRLASMTKPIVGVTALALIDQGRLGLDDPLTRWLADFRPKLADGREPLITVRHLLTHTAGLSYGFLEAPDGAYHRLGVSDGLDARGLSLAENLRRIASAPLLFEPGTAWHYSVAIDVLGAVIEQVTGMTLPEAVEQIVTAPLGISSIRFVAAPGTVLATPYGDAAPRPEPMTEPFSLPFGPGAIVYSPSRAFDANAFASGGVGMVGTAGDYLRFVEAIRTGGGAIIRPETMAAMTRNTIGDLPVAAAGPGFGWGLGVAVLKDPVAAKLPLNPGSWHWAGVYGTNFWVDPVQRLSVVTLTNTAVAGMSGDFPTALRHAAYPG